MKKIFTLVVLLGMVAGAFAQTNISFTLSKEGKFVTADGKSSVVVPFEGKDAKTIYAELISNISGIYKKPQKVLTTEENKSITVYAKSDSLFWYKDMIRTMRANGYYAINIAIEDNKITFDLPVTDEIRYVSGTAFEVGTMEKLVTRYYYKDGVMQEKAQKFYDRTLNGMLTICNQIINGKK